MTRSHMEQMESGGDLEKLFQCPLCRQYVGPSSKKKKAWFQQDSERLILMALGFVFQLETHSQGTVEEEISFIESRIREAEKDTKLRETALKSLNMAKEAFEKMIPALRAADSGQERKNLTMDIKALMNLAIMSHLIPGFFRQAQVYEVAPDGMQDEIEKWNPHVQRWLVTLQLLGPYVWD
jgi:hypothetical protein